MAVGCVVALAVFFFVLQAAAAPSEAKAFLGESLVLDASGAFTSAGESILTSPTFLTDNVGEAVAQGGELAGSNAAAVFEGSGLLPALGPAVLALGAGVGVGSAICHVAGIEGCWLFKSTEAQAVEEQTTGTGPQRYGQWQFFEKFSPLTETGWYSFSSFPADVYVWDFEKVSRNYAAPISGLAGTPTKCGKLAPLGYTGQIISLESGGGCGGVERMTAYAYFKSALHGRTLTHAATNEGLPEYKYTAPTEWKKKLAAALKGAPSGSPAGMVGEKIASEISGSHVPNPYALTATVPDCDGLLYSVCEGLITERGLNPVHKELDWQHAVTADPAEQVEELQPARSTEVEKGSSVTVVTNPEEAKMPIVVPAPGSNETYAQYVARLNPALSPHEVVLGELNEDPAYGPNAVARTSPAAGTRLDPSVSTSIAVEVNPEDAPAPSEGGGFTPPTVPAIAIPGGAVSPCGVFPFGLFCWVKEAIEELNVAPHCPSATVPLKVNGEEDGIEMGLCKVPEIEKWLGLWRKLVLFFFTIGCAWTFAKATGAIGAGGDGGEE